LQTKVALNLESLSGINRFFVKYVIQQQLKCWSVISQFGYLTIVMHIKVLITIITFLVASTCFGEECEISGKAILWAYDACFWEFETDDTLHPEVIKCVEKSEKLMKSVGECKARETFKRKICDLAIEYKTEGINKETCMSKDKALGPSVREGGI
jgi:hypothetical protein